MDTYQRKCEKVNIPTDIIAKADEGDATAQLVLGKVYYNAIYIDHHDVNAFNWIRRSAEQGNMEAQFKLGDLYALGYGVEKSLSDSYKWYTKSAIQVYQGYKKALIRIHNHYQEDIRIRCRGRLNDEEKMEGRFRELYEFRLYKHKLILNDAVKYYSGQFTSYQSLNQNDANVQLNLAFLYEHGYGVKKCSRWAFEYYSLAAEQGNTDAQYNLGHLYQKHKRKKFNYRDAFKWYTKSAQGGNIASQRCLAYFYLKGLATDTDYKAAVSWYTKAAKAGDSQSQVTLGLLYRKGNYLEQDLLTAARWYTLAARQGNIVAQNCLSQLYQRGMLKNVVLEEDMQEYLTEESMNNRLCSKISMDISKLGDLPGFKQLYKFAKCALIGDGPAMYEIGLIYYHGDKGFPQDKDTGIKLIKSAANREHKEAQFMLAELYNEEDSIEQDYHKSCIWYKEITKQKNPVAQCAVGVMYNEGLGVRKDSLEASKWFIWAADQGDSDAQFNLGMLRLYGKGIRKDKKEAMEWFYKAAYQKNAQAFYKLGEFYFNDKTCSEENKEKGLKLLRIAAENDCMNAQLFLGDKYKDGNSVPQDIPKSIEYYTMAVDSGDAYIQCKLAIVYLHGDGVSCDYTKAYRLFKQATQKSDFNFMIINPFQIPLMYDPNIKDYSKVIDMFTEITEKEIDHLDFNIGSIYEHGIKSFFKSQALNINYAEAKKWYLAASKKGDSRADYRLGIMYEEGKGIDKKMTTAIYYFNKAVEKDNHDAMLKLANIYLQDDNVDQDQLEAFRLLSKMSNSGNLSATKILNDLRRDKSYPKELDEKKQISMLEKTTEEGYTQLQYQLGIYYERNKEHSKAFKWLCCAADIGVTDAYYRLGVMYEEGRGVKRNYKKAAKMYQKTIEKDHEDACFRLGQLYQYGNGVNLNYLKAYEFYKKAADMNHAMAKKVLNITLQTEIQPKKTAEKNYFDVQSKEYKKSLKMCKYVAKHGNVELQFQIGFVYEHNYSIPDYEESYRWYSMAATTSHREALYRLGLLFEKGFGVSQDYQKAIQLYKQAIQLGSDNALYRLGTAYHYGKGVKSDPVKAIKCYTRSAELGNPKYQCELGRLYEEGVLVQKNLLEAIKWYTKAYTQGYDGIRSKLYGIYEYRPYETFFFEKLFQNLLIASCNHFSLTGDYKARYLESPNNQLGYMCLFGIGTEKNLKQSFQYFMKAYSDKERRSIRDFGFFQYPGFSFGEKIEILKEFEKDKKCTDQLRTEELYIWGMVYYDGIVQTQEDKGRNMIKGYIPIVDQDPDDPSQNILLKKNYPKAFKYFKNAADKNHPEALFQLGIMYHCGYGVQKDKKRGDECFDIVPRDDSNLMCNIAVLYHTHNEIQDFSKASEYYNHLKKARDKEVDKLSFGLNQFYSLGQLGLGLLYEYGDGVAQNYQKALECYKNLADKEVKVGEFRLGLMYYFGKGVLIDYRKAFGLFKSATTTFFPGYLFPYVFDEYSLQISDSKKKPVYCSKRDGEICGESHYYLGLMYKYGQGVMKDENEAQKHFRKAFEMGCKRAKK